MLGYTLEQLNRTDDAAAEYERGLALEPDYAFVEVSLAGIYVQKRKFTDAVRLFRKGLPEMKADADSYLQYGEALQQTGDLEEAEKVLQRCVGMDDNNIEAHTLLAEVLQAEGKSELALRETKYAVTLAMKKAATDK